VTYFISRRKIREISRVSYITELKAASCYRSSQVFRFYSMINFWRDFREFIKYDFFLRKWRIARNTLMLNNLLHRTWNIEYEIIISLFEFFSFDIYNELHLKNLRNWEFYNYKYKYFFPPIILHVLETEIQTGYYISFNIIVKYAYSGWLLYYDINNRQRFILK